MIAETSRLEVAEAFDDAKKAPYPDLSVGIRDVYAQWTESS